jgi:SOS response regulatory protein OraA/RecX/outer membrane protein OmpA-like peptidoglycan-associated protein
MVDGAFFCACNEDVLLLLGLRSGMELLPHIEQQLRTEERAMQMRQKAWTFCAYKPRTQAQVFAKCVALGMTDEEIEQTIQWLKSFQQINDDDYARRFIEASRERKPMALADIRNRLRAKGIPDDTIGSALAGISTDDELNAARRVAQRKLATIQQSDSVRERLTRFLAGRRYSWGVIKTVVGELLPILCLLIFTQTALTARVDTSCNRRVLPWTVNQWQPTTMPVESHDGRLLYLDRKYHPDNTSGTSDADDVWVARLDSLGHWQEPERLVLTQGIPQPQVVFQESMDGLRMLVAGEYQQSRRLCFAVLSRSAADAPFTKANVMNVEGATELQGRYYGTMSDDGLHVIVALLRPGGRADLDLYYTSTCSGEWLPLASLGRVINTDGFEGAPHLARDGATLYFASNGHEPRRGKLDLYVSRKVGNDWLSWTTPRWMGACVNTVGDETTIALRGNGSSALITSWDEAEERQAIYSVTLPDTVRPLPWCKLELIVRDAKTGLPIPSASAVLDDSARGGCHKRLVATPDGLVVTVLQANSRYRLQTEAPGYASVPQSLRLQQLDSVITLRLTAYMYDVSIPVASVYFDRATSTVPQQEFQQLRSIIDSMGIRSIGFKVTGYTDELGSKPFNQTLSADRARAVVQALVAIGIPKDRIVFEGRGVEIPKVSAAMRENPQSRRVDIFPVTDPRLTPLMEPVRPSRPSSLGPRPR